MTHMQTCISPKDVHMCRYSHPTMHRPSLCAREWETSVQGLWKNLSKETSLTKLSRSKFK
jgi:hypothetical protein